MDKAVRHPSKLRVAFVLHETGRLPMTALTPPILKQHHKGHTCRVCRKVKTRNGGRVCSACLNQ